MSLLGEHLLTLILFTPLAGALVILMAGRQRVTAIKWMANASAAGGLLAALPLWFAYEPHGRTWQFVVRAQWIPSIGASYHLGVDGFSILLILLTALIVWIAVLWSWNAVTERVKEYYVCILVLETGVLGVFMALDFLLFFLFWELLLLPTYWLIRIWGDGRKLRSAIRLLLYAVAASVVMFAGILALYFHNQAVTGAFSFDITQYHQLVVPFGIQRWVFLAFCVGFAINVPIFPLHLWLPDAQTDAPTAASVILAAVLLKMGTYGFIRFILPILPDASRQFVPIIVALSIVGIIYGALAAFAQSDWKRLVAYSSVSQMGVVMLGMFAFTPDGLTGSMVQQINHGISTGALFLIVGVAYERVKTREIAAYGGLFRRTPLFATVFLIMTMAWIGVPALNGFIGEALILRGVYTVHKGWAAAGAAGIVLGAVCMCWLYHRTMLGRVGNPTNVPLRDLSAREIAILAPLVLLAIWIGLYPAPLLRRLETSAGRVIARVNPAYAPYVAQGADCPSPAKPEPSAPPAPFVLVEPCADGSEPAEPATPRIPR